MLDLLLVLIAIALGLYWLDAVRSKDIARIAARKYCEIRDVQLLDQTVQQIRISMSRDTDDAWRVWRMYRFEYSLEGVERNFGTIKMLGPQVLDVVLDTDSIQIH